MTTTVTTLELPTKLKRRLTVLARKTGQSPHAWIIDAVAERLEREEARLAFIDAAEAAAVTMDAGDEVFAADDVHEWLRAKVQGQAFRRPAPVRRARR
ncbi:MAG: ribbon-helix-helix protein, CopG family [Myxococcaceae bacterium]|jgi:predicted transcriptional regulator|nr:ribbon-helix-helix protein, CopG family [Myxococcaceae bacterium]